MGPESDGLLRLVISEADPGDCNWLATRGHRIGTMQFRLSRAEEADLPSFRTRVIGLSELAESGLCSLQ